MDLVHEFKTALKNLYRSKPPIPRARIQLVASVAIKANRMYKHIVMYMEKYAEKIPGKYKLTALCVIDTIIRESIKEFGKNKDAYAPRFKKKLKLIFQFLKKCKQRDKSRMVHILTLWQKHKIYKSELVEPLLSIVSPELRSHKKSKNQEKPGGAVHSVAANALAIIHQQHTQIQALQQLQALKNLNSLTPSFVTALQTLQSYQRQIAEGKQVEIPPELIDQLRLFQSLVQQSADPQPMDYRGLLRTNYQQVQESAGYSALPSALELPGISSAPPLSPRDRRLAPYYSISSNKAAPIRRNHTSLLDDFDYGDDEDDAVRIAAQKRRVELEKKRVDIAAKETARARERTKRKRRKELKKKKTVPGNATPTQDEVDSPRRYKNRDIDNELERLLMTSAVKLGAFTNFNKFGDQVGPGELAQAHQLSRPDLSPVSALSSPSRIPALFNHGAVSPISVGKSPSSGAKSPSSGAKSPSSGDNDEIVMDEYFDRSPSNISDELADDSMRLIICTEDKEEVRNGTSENDPFSDSEEKGEEVEPTPNPDKESTEIVMGDIADIPPEDAISLPDSNLTMDELETSEHLDSPLFSEDSREDEIPENNKETELNTETTNNCEKIESPYESPVDQSEAIISELMEHSISPVKLSPETREEYMSPSPPLQDPYDPLYPTRDLEDISVQATPDRLASLSPPSPYASSLEEVFPDLALSNRSPSPSDVSIPAEEAISPITGSPESDRSVSPPFARNPSPPGSPVPFKKAPRSIFDVTLPFDNITPPRASNSSSSCISDVSPVVVRENSLECVTPPTRSKRSPLRTLLESVRERVRDMEAEEVTSDSSSTEYEKEGDRVVTLNKSISKEVNGLRSVIIVKTSKPSNKKVNSKNKKRRRLISSSSSSSSSSSQNSSVERKKETKKSKKQTKNKKEKIRISSRIKKIQKKEKTANPRSKIVKQTHRRQESPDYRRVRRVRSESIDSLESLYPLPSNKDCLVIYTNIIKVECQEMVIEKYHLRKYISACVGDIELFDIMNGHTAALIQLSNRKSADLLKQRLEESDFQCTWVPGFKVLPGIYWDSVNGVTYVPWIKVTDDPPYNVFSLQKGGTIDFSEIKKELELIDRQRAIEKQKETENKALEAASEFVPIPAEKATKRKPIRLCCQDSEQTDSSAD